jgi:hypothetical protein
MGSSLIQTPVALAMAWPTAVSTGRVLPSPISLAPNGGGGAGTDTTVSTSSRLSEVCRGPRNTVSTGIVRSPRDDQITTDAPIMFVVGAPSLQIDQQIGAAGKESHTGGVP